MKTLLILLALTVPALAQEDATQAETTKNEILAIELTESPEPPPIEEPYCTWPKSEMIRAGVLSRALEFYAAGYRDDGEIARLTLGWGEQDDARYGR